MLHLKILLRHDVALLVNRGVLRSNEDTGQLEFFHQTFFEHAAARAFLHHCKDKAIDTIVIKSEQTSGTDNQIFSFLL